MSVKTNFDAWATALWLVTIFTILVLMAGCGPQDFTTDLGIQVEVEYGAGAPSDAEIDRVWRLTAGVLGDLEDPPGGFLLTYVPDTERAQELCGFDEPIGGCYRTHRRHAVVVRDNPDPCERDAWAHEIVHHWEEATGRPADATHSKFWFADLLPVIEEARLAGCDWGLHRRDDNG